MDPGVEFFLIVDQREVKLFLRLGVAFLQSQRDLFFKAGDVQRRIELQIKDSAALLRILRVLVILGLPQLVIKSGHVKGVTGIGELDLRGQQRGRIEVNLVLRAHRQRFFRRKDQG
ncbi:hypothetical protein D3C80_839200 [compost metagenome]